MVKGGKTSATGDAQNAKDFIVTLRKALRDDAGNDKDVLAGFPAFLSYSRNEIDPVVLEFATGSMLRRDKKLKAFCYDLAKATMEGVYDESGFGWDDEEEEEKLTAKEARFIIVRNEAGAPVGYVNFRFTLQGEVVDLMEGEPCVFVYDLHLEEGYQRKGLGRHCMQLLELVGRKEEVLWLMTPVHEGHDEAEAFVTSKLKGFEEEDVYNDYDEFTVYSKRLAPPAARAVAPPAPVKSSAKASPDSVLPGPRPVAREMSGAEDLASRLEAVASLD